MSVVVVCWAVPVSDVTSDRGLSSDFQKLHSRIKDLSSADLLLELERSKAFLLSRNFDSPSNVSFLYFYSGYTISR